LVYEDRLSDAETRHLARGVFETISRHVAEVAHVTRLKGVGVRLENPELLTEAYARGQGVVVVSAHLGCFVRMFTFPRLLGVRLAAIMKKQRNERLLEWSRAHIKKCFDIDVVVKKTARDRIPEFLQEGRVVVLFADQHPRKGGFLATFFGRPVSAAAGPAVYAKRYDSPLIVCTSTLHSDGMHVVRFDGPVSTDGSHEEISQRWLAILEARIREHPEQWMWMHRRWRDLAPVLL
jgi:KDO2-lipid IV(A) lauroyltransferase